MLDGKRIIIEELRLNEYVYNGNEQAPLFHQNKTINLAVDAIILKPEGKRPMTWKEFSNGYLS
jgi:hypothetical protein